VISMAKRTLVTISDDLDGTEGATEVSFGYGGVSYVIDLSEKNQAKLEKALAPYLQAARRAPGASRQVRGAGAAPAGLDLAAVRLWAAANDIVVAERGRVAKTVIDAYQAAN
jgi:hypothetical protein